MKTDQGHTAERTGTRPSIREGVSQQEPLKGGQGTVVCVSTDRIVVVNVDASGEALRIDITQDHPIADAAHESPAEQEKAVLTALEQCIASLPRSRRSAHLMVLEPLARHKILHLPHLKGRKLHNLAHFTIAGGVPMESRLRIQGDSYEGHSKGMAVRAAGIPESLLRGIRQVALFNHCKLHTICTRPAGGPAIVDLFGEEEAARGRYMLIELQGAHLRLSLLAEGEVRFSRSVEIPPAQTVQAVATHVITEVQRTSIFVGGRFREKPGDHLVLLADSHGEMDDFASRLGEQLQAPLFVVRPRLRVQGATHSLPPNLLVDACALVIKSDASPLGAFNVRPASLRWLGLAAVATSIVICTLMGGPLWERGQEAALATHQNAELLPTLREELAALPDRRTELSLALDRRDRIAGRLEDLLGVLSPQVATSPLIQDLLSRMPPEVIVTNVSIKRAGGEGSAGFDALQGRRIVEISGHSIANLAFAASRTPAILQSLRGSPNVAGGVDLSGQFDPFAVRKSGKVPLYPVKFRLFVENGR